MDRTEFAVRVAREAGAVTLDYFNQADLEVEVKSDGSPVTEADRACESELRAAIAKQFPDDAIVGEELDDTQGASGYRWIIDPIDGTVSFACGVPLYGTLLALEHNGEPHTGVIVMPALDEVCYATRGRGAWHLRGRGKPRRAQVSRTAGLPDATVCVTSIDIFDSVGRRETYLHLADLARVNRGWGDCYAFLLVATGRVDAIVEPSLSPWDIAPMRVILEEAGGRCTDWEGGTPLHPACAVASNGLIHDEILTVTRRNPGEG